MDVDIFNYFFIIHLMRILYTVMSVVMYLNYLGYS